jgi:hypothetical protein
MTSGVMSTMHKPIVLFSLLGLLSFYNFPALGQNSDRSKELLQHSKANSWIHNYDPTLITRRLLSELSYEDQGNDQSLLKLETSLRWPFPINDHLTFGAQMMIPLDWKDSGTEDTTGLGNLEFRIGVAGKASQTLRYGIGLNAELSSASDDELGGTNMVLRTINAIRWDIMDGVNIGCNIEYSFTPLENGPDKVSALQLKFPVAFKLTDNWSAAISYKPRWDFEEDEDRHRLHTSATRNWGSNHQYAWSLGTELPLSTEHFNWKIISGFTCFL